jgi:osmotically-inducible protein OsmY
VPSDFSGHAINPEEANMKINILWLSIALVIGLSILATGCPPSVDQKIRENTKIGAFDEATHAKDLALKSAVQTNIETDLPLRWYAQTFGITVEVSHSVATVQMKVRTQAQHDLAISLAKQTKDIRDVVDNITIDESLDDPPFEE